MLMEPQPLDQMLADIPQQLLDQKITEEKHLAEIARSLTDWKSVTGDLGLRVTDEEAIEDDNTVRTADAKRLAVLRKWRQIHGKYATYRNLANCFYKARNLEVVEVVCKVCKLLQPTASPPQPPVQPLPSAPIMGPIQGGSGGVDNYGSILGGRGRHGDGGRHDTSQGPNLETLEPPNQPRSTTPEQTTTLPDTSQGPNLETFEPPNQPRSTTPEQTTTLPGDVEKRSHLAACERAIKEKESLDQTAIHCVFMGMPRSGKSSLMRRLLGKRPSSCASTGVAERLVRVELRKSTVHVSGLLWCELEDLDDEATLLMCDASKIVPEDVTRTQPDEPFSLSKFLRKLFEWTQRTKQHQQASSSPSLQSPAQPQVPEEQGTKHPLEVFGDAFQKKWSKLKDLLDDHWTVYLTDTGGQPEFQELLPVLVCGPSVFFLVFRLDLELNSRYQVEYINSSGESIVPYEAGLTVQETLLQSLATIASTSITRMVGSETVNIVPRAFFVGTHKDRVSDQHLRQIDNTLQAVVKRTEAYREGMIQFASENRLVLTVNNLSEGEEDVQQIRAAVERIGKQGDNYRVKTPFSWHMFSNILQQMKPPVLEYEQCFKVAQKCGINTRDEMSDALQFLHENVGVIRYYRDVPELREFIIKDLRYLFDVITDLLVATFMFGRTDPSLQEQFTHKGIFPLEVFEKLAKSTEFLPPSKLVTLLQHLNIVALLRKDGVSSQYFIPCVLAHSESSQSALPDTTPSHACPLLVTFKSGYCPKGLFGSLAVYLLDNKMESRLEWVLEEDKIFRDQICFSVGPYDSFQLKVQTGFLSIELHAFSGASTRRISLASVCSEVRQCISSSISKVCEVLHHSQKAAHSFGLFCPEEVDANQTPHPAILTFYDGKPCILKCPITHKRFDLPDGCLVWFNEDCSTVVDRREDIFAASEPHLFLDATTSGAATQSSPNACSESQVIKDTKPRMAQLMMLKTAKGDKVDIIKTIAPDWKQVGFLMDLDPNGRKVECIETDHAHKRNGSVICCQEIFRLWLDGPDATWGNLIELLIDSEQINLAEQVKNALGL